jgi:hypothetical protein
LLHSDCKVSSVTMSAAVCAIIVCQLRGR